MAAIYYSKDHLWLRVNGKEAVIGISDYAQEELGIINNIEIEEKGNIIDQDGIFDLSAESAAQVTSQSQPSHKSREDGGDGEDGIAHEQSEEAGPDDLEYQPHSP